MCTFGAVRFTLWAHIKSFPNIDVHHFFLYFKFICKIEIFAVFFDDTKCHAENFANKHTNRDVGKCFLHWKALEKIPLFLLLFYFSFLSVFSCSVSQIAKNIRILAHSYSILDVKWRRIAFKFTTQTRRNAGRNREMLLFHMHPTSKCVCVLLYLCSVFRCTDECDNWNKTHKTLEWNTANKNEITWEELSAWTLKNMYDVI